MGVFTLSRAESAEPGIYPFDPHKHLRQVAELVSAVFAQELDAEGRNALYEMQMVGRFGPLLGGLFGASLFTDFVAGYVWVERGEVLGNATLQRIDYGGMRWRISNVAVTPEHRGRGIARSLMLSCLSEIAQQGGAWAVLQVRIDNPPARKLYESLGFTDVYQEGIWRLAGLSRRPSTPDTRWPLELLPATAWRERFELAQAAQTSLADWIGPIQKAEYEVGLLQAWGEALGHWTSLYQVQRWGVRSNGVLQGAIETQSSITDDVRRMRFAIRPRARGHLETTIVQRGLQTLAEAPPAPIVVAHSADHTEGVAALEAAGFRPQRVLLTMRRQITPADALL